VLVADTEERQVACSLRRRPAVREHQRSCRVASRCAASAAPMRSGRASRSMRACARISVS
jgi:hypothetical protein